MGPLVKTADDIQAVITLYQNFVTKFPNASRPAEAKAARSTGDRQDRPGEVQPLAGASLGDVLLKQWTEAAKPTPLDMYRPAG